MEPVSAQCMLFPTPSSKQEFAMYAVIWFKVIQGQRSWLHNNRSLAYYTQSIAHGWFPIWFLLTPSSYLSPVLKYLTSNFDDLESAHFKVIQGQRSWSQSEAHWWFPILPSLRPTLYLSRHLRYLMWKFCEVHLGRFKVIRGQRWWCQSTAHIRLPLTPSWDLSQFLK